MTEIERLRFYLRDPAGASEFFSDDELNELLSATSSFEEAIALGWVVKASAAATNTTTAGAVTAVTVGKVREEYASGGTTTSSDTALKLAAYWFSKAGVNAGRWYELQPAEGFIAETIDVTRALAELSPSYDLSRLGYW